MSKKILVFGLPGSGKTHLSKRLSKHLLCAWYNADVIRGAANDWDFTPEGRARQADRMRTFADFEKENGRTVICDFVAPTKYARETFGADVTIWLDTIEEGRFEDTNKIFERVLPEEVDFYISEFMTDEQIKELSNEI